jgi:hypothetical protein
MLCQKTKQGTISPHDKTLYNFLLYSDDPNSLFRTNNKLFDKSFYGDVNETNTLISSPHSQTNHNHFMNQINNSNNIYKKNTNLKIDTQINDRKSSVNTPNSSYNTMNDSPDVVLFKRVRFN